MKLLEESMVQTLYDLGMWNDLFNKKQKTWAIKEKSGTSGHIQIKSHYSL